MNSTKNNSKVLFFFTEHYPYGNGEAFIENEIKYLSNSFSQICIISKGNSSDSVRDFPNNVKIINMSFDYNIFSKLFSLFSFFSILFWQEFFLLKKRNHKISINKIRYALVSLYRAKKISLFTEKIIHPFFNKYDICLYSYWCMDESIGISLLKIKYPKLITLTRAHRMDIYFYSSENCYLPYKQFILDNINAFFTISLNAKLYMRDTLKLKLNDKVFVSHLGTRKTININKSVIKSKSFNVISCSNIYPNKRVHMISESLMNINIPLCWNHYGDFMIQTEQSYKALFKHEISLLKYSNHTFTKKGNMSNCDILSDLKNISYDLFINLSESEGIPVSIMEAFSFGIPVIATNVGGVSEIIIDGFNGFLVDKNCSPNDVSIIIRNYYNYDISKMNKFRLNAYRTWESKFNAKTNYENFVRSIHKLK